jgi:nucleotide-binding universal stress UspA family protein
MMLSLRTILCPVDMSPASRIVLSWTGLFAQVFDANVKVLHAESLDPPRYFTQSQLETLAVRTEANRAILREELLQRTREVFPPGVSCDVVVAEGHPIPVILRHTALEPPDLIILGSHGRSGVARLLLGSVAENIVREATCFTLIVKGTEGVSPSVKRVLCPVNFTDLARQCLEVSSAVTVAFKAKLDVAHTVEIRSSEPEEEYQRLCRWVPDETRERCDLVEIVREGAAAEQIVLLAREHAADLIVLGAQHSPFLEFTTLGTTTERVIRHSSCSVLLVPVKDSRFRGKQ